MNLNRRGFLRACLGAAAAVPAVALCPPLSVEAPPLPTPAPPTTEPVPPIEFDDKPWIGKTFVLEDTTIYVKREAYMMEFFAYETMGYAG